MPEKQDITIKVNRETHKRIKKEALKTKRTIRATVEVKFEK